jgi:cellulose synthase/poly-beta-1,6-N-acetylglucosamine synthase-like glycosyltransferase
MRAQFRPIPSTAEELAQFGDEDRSMHRCPKEVRAGSLRAATEIRFTWAGIAVTVLGTVLVGRRVGAVLIRALADGQYAQLAVTAVFFAIVLLLISGSLAYQLSRRGYFARLARHCPPRLSEIWQRLGDAAPLVTILVPSYKEDGRVIEQSLLSAALQHYPNRNVVLLVDDPPLPASADDRARLAETRQLPDRIRRLLEPPRRWFDEALADAWARLAARCIPGAGDIEAFAVLYDEAARWFEEQAVSYPVADHTDAVFVTCTFRDRARYLRGRARRLRGLARSHRRMSRDVLLDAQREIAGLFRVEVSSFERKRYVNLSHAPNKAMNLNTYIGLSGKRVCELERDGRLHLESGGEGGEEIPDPKYFVTLDADSILAPDYVLRLVDVLERPGAERVAVIQTPYSAFPRPSGLLERIAGATTDIQHLIHQGFTAHGATYWVGANAVLRTEALRDIAVVTTERGFPVTRYIQDRTVIEDTESSIDLIVRGWRLVNYPERLSYSATPPDFGSLLIQRRRWANGGLLILPKLVAHVRRVRRDRATTRRRFLAESFLRLHYLTSLATANVGLIVLLSSAPPSALSTVWLPLSAVPYYLLYARDLVQAGYGLGDVLRVYALNLLLVPVHLGGVLRSLRQAWSGAPSPFHRTPKVRGRTAAPLGYVIGELAFLLLMLAVGWRSVLGARWLNAAFAFCNGAALVYALVAFVGLGDVALSLTTNERVRRLTEKRAGSDSARRLPPHEAISVTVQELLRLDSPTEKGTFPAGTLESSRERVCS